MEFPAWAAFGLCAAVLSAAMMLIQERLAVSGFALAFWNKIGCLFLMVGPVLYFGMPDSPAFYALVATQALLWVISDVVFFNALPVVGAGVISRLLPLSTIVTFCAWFLIDPAQLQKWMAMPWRSAGVIAALTASVYFAMRLKRCPVSWPAFKRIWFVIFASVIGPIGYKLIAREAAVEKGAFSFVFCEAAVMILCWAVWWVIRRPVPREVLFAVSAAKGGFAIASVSALMIASNFAAISFVDNPALVHAVRITDTVMILAFYRWRRKVEVADVGAGLGIAACAAITVFLKSI